MVGLGSSGVSSSNASSLLCYTERALCLLSSIQVSSDPSMYIEVENEVTAVGGVKLSRLKCNREGKEWETVLTSRILTAAGSW